MNKLKFILFDCWGTLITYSVKSPYFLHEHILKYCDNPDHITKEQLKEFISNFFNDYYMNENKYESSIYGIVNYICLFNNLKPKVTIKQLVDLSFGQQYNPVPVENIKKFLSFLDSNGIGYGVCSNTVFDSQFTKKYIVNTLGMDNFQFVLASSDVAVKKPNKMFFHTGAKLAGYKPNECIYIGDNFYADVFGSYNSDFFNSIWINLENNEIPFEKHPDIPKDISFLNAHSYDDVIEYIKGIISNE